MANDVASPPLLADRRFLHLYLAGAVSQFGTQIGHVALPLLAVTSLGAGAGEVGLLSALGTLTVLVMGLPAGTWVDRLRRRPVMVAADLVRAGVLLSVPVAWWAGWLAIGHLYAVAVVVGAGTLLFDVAAASMLPGLVGRERLTAANTLLVSTGAGMDIAGRSAAGLLVQALGAPVAVALDALSYLWSAAWLRRVPEGLTLVRSGERPPAGGLVTEGLRFLFGNRVLVAAAAQGAMVNLGFPLCSVLLPVLLVDELGYPEWVLGAYLAAGSAGVLAGSAAAHLVGRWLGGTVRATWLVGMVTSPVALLVPFLGAGAWLWVAAVAWFVLLFRVGVNNVLLVSLRQRVTPDGLLGRVTATMRLLLTGAVGIGGLLAGGIGEVWGVRAALWAGAAFMTLSWVPILLLDRGRHDPGT